MSKGETKQTENRKLQEKLEIQKAKLEKLWGEVVANWSREKYTEYNVLKQKIEVTKNRIFGKFEEKNPGCYRGPNSSKKSNWG